MSYSTGRKLDSLETGLA